VITHLGSSRDLDKNKYQKQIQEKILEGLIEIHKNYKGKALLVLEIAAGSGNIIGDNLKDFNFFFKKALENNFQLGFCFDTCHAFSAGCDLRTSENVQETFQKIDSQIGLANLKCIHFNDSKADFNSRVDRHEHIGEGKIGEAGMKAVAQKAQQLGVNLYLETKHDRIIEDIKMTRLFLNYSNYSNCSKK
jgi:deoxyribonuclease-4